MAEQQRKTKPTHKNEETAQEEVSRSAEEAKSGAIKDELDDLLDEIDDVLETNAEEFVKNYVQKGGE